MHMGLLSCLYEGTIQIQPEEIFLKVEFVEYDHDDLHVFYWDLVILYWLFKWFIV